MNILKKFISLYNRMEENLLVFSFAFLILIVFIQVVSRLIGNANSWSEELARYVYIWECWLGLSLCQRYHEHIRITIISEKFPIISHKVNEIIVNAICICVASILGYFGYVLVVQQMNMGTTSPYIDIPYWIIYMAMPVSCTIYAIRVFIEEVHLIVTGEEMPVEHTDEGVGI